MVPEIRQHRAELENLCRRHHVRRLELFGSAVHDEPLSPGSDLDFLVEFEPAPPGGYAEAFFGLQEALAVLFGRPVDLVVPSAIRNPYFKESVDETRTLVYAA